MAEKFPNLMTDTKPQIQEIENESSKMREGKIPCLYRNKHNNYNILHIRRYINKKKVLGNI